MAEVHEKLPVTVAAPSRDSFVNVALATIGTATQAVIQVASDPVTAAAFPWLAPLGVVTGAIAGHEINRLAARVDRAQARRAATSNLLVNQHLARAVSRAIGQRLEAFAATRTDSTALAKVAAQATDWWPHLVENGVESIKALDDREFTHRIAEHLTGHASGAPTAKDWRVVLEVAASYVGVDLTPSLGEAASEVMAEHFMDDAIEALKMDFVHDGEAFARVSLAFFAEISFGIQDLSVSVDAQGHIGRQTLDVAQRTLDAIQDVASKHLPARLSRIPTQLPRRPAGGTLVGRQTLRSVLADRLRKRLDTDVVGPAGYGKTAVAAEAIRDAVGSDTEAAIEQSVYPDGIVLLDLYALRRGDLSEAWSHLAHSFGAPEVPDQSPLDRARNACIGKRALVIVEGAEEAGAELGALLAVLNREAVRLVLTRDPAQATIVHQRLNLTEELTREESFDLLKATCPNVESDVADRVYAALGGHPLALTWAGAALADPTGDVEDLLNQLEAAHLPTLYEPGYESHTLKWLYERGVRRLDDDARRILRAIGSLAHGPFPLAAIEAVLDEPDAHKRSVEGLRALARAALIVQVPSRRNEWTMSHTLAYRFGRDHHTASDDDVKRLAAWCASTIESAMSLRTPDDFSVLRDALRHGDALLGSGAQFKTVRALYELLLYRVGNAERLGSVDIARSAIRSAAAWLDRLPAAIRATDWTKRERSVVSLRSGVVAVAEGDLRSARRAFEEALKVREALVADDPANILSQRDVFLGHTKLGGVLGAQGDWASALTAFRHSLAIAEALAGLKPENRELQRDVSVSHYKIGVVLFEQGENAGALAAFQRALAIAEALAAREPANTEWQRDLAARHDRIGGVLAAQGDEMGARAAFQRAHAMREALVARDPTNPHWQRALSASHDKIGRGLIAQGDRAGGLAAFRRRLAIAEALAARDPANTQWQRDLSHAYKMLASFHEKNGDYAEALQLAERSLNIGERLSALDSTNAVWQKDARIGRGQVKRLRKLTGS